MKFSVTMQIEECYYEEVIIDAGNRDDAVCKALEIYPFSIVRRVVEYIEWED
jgi:hypothetical protein